MTARIAPRLLRDLGLAALVSAVAAVVIVLTVAKPETLFAQLVYSLCIGLGGFAVVDTVRLRWAASLPANRLRWAALLALTVVVAPLAHFTGLHAGALLLGESLPPLSEYANTGRVSMIVFTLIGLVVMTMLAEHRERLARIRQEHADARLRAETIERQALQARLRLLQAQIEPHMLFNTLANLQGLIALDPARADTMLDQLIQFLRATLGASRADSTTLGEEFAAMEAYLGLMQVRMGARLAYRLALPPSLRAARLPPMLLQPLVENAIVHGLEPAIDGGEVVLSASAHGGLLEIRVRDTGIGPRAAAAQRAKGGGIGMDTTRERLRVLYGQRAALDLTPGEPQGALAILTLPLETA
ncbi:histidine kinase [Massilia sp. G4R7]|uniref:Histidine kinase n=1 Tax=Massilia phyllostachyos TaxID=2898585 RepID=A0ABS8QBT5_9BURK|nr:histidine kinase [Massilia phyllostachyos]MCD2519054.1 histidine kinase [Massilia phyllostachyos]